MKISFRVDASDKIGTGHLMRCMTLAVAAKRRGAETQFICRHVSNYLADFLEQKGHRVARLPEVAYLETVDELAHAHWLGTSQTTDARDTLQVMGTSKWDWLIVDHYALDARWEVLLRQSAKRILVLDDIADRLHDCDILLDQNLCAEMETRYLGKVPVGCQLLLGPKYALLREEFCRWRAQAKTRSGPVRRVLVFLGGVDSQNITGKALKAITALGEPSLRIDVVIGANHAARESIERECRDLGYHCHIQTEHMAELMAKADLGIGAAGSASWERCCLGLPAICVIAADNQRPIAEALDAYGALKNLGDASILSPQSLMEAFRSALRDTDSLTMQSMRGMSLVDGEGMKNVCVTLFDAL